MAENITNCAWARESMADAASGVLSSGRLADFEMHLRDCATCREEFRRMQTLLQAVDQGVRASVAAEPSPQLLANIRQAIAEQPCRAPIWLPRSAWLAAAGVCAVLAIGLFTIRTFRNTHETAPRFTANPVGTSPTQNRAAVTPNHISPVKLANSAPPRKPALAVRRASARALHRAAPEPEIIVEPGQMQAVLRFAAAMQRGQIDGAQLLADQKQAAEPLKIKPLVIAPLKIAALDDAVPPPPASGKTGAKDFVAGCSN
jgi:predicted anti-sigma-YlaC factor YlaD